MVFGDVIVMDGMGIGDFAGGVEWLSEWVFTIN
jgi:hypothetical protein